MAASGSRGGAGAGGRPPATVERMMNYVDIEYNRVANPSTLDYPNTVPGIAGTVDLESFRQSARFHITRLEGDTLQFDLVGVDASLANALRRVLIAEVPTMAIEKVFVMNNTSIIHDDVLAHRLGLVPIKADPRKFEFKTRDQDPTDGNTIVFTLNIKCTKNPDAPADATDPKVRYINSTVYSRDLVWVPQGAQAEAFADEPIGPVHGDIVIAKMRPGQEIDIEMHCEKGMGKLHAKWSPVATATYRLLPTIELLDEFVDEEADKLAQCFSPGVIKVEQQGNRRVARVANARNDTVSREVFRHPEFLERVRLGRKRDTFLFQVESTGILPPDVLTREALLLLMEKTRKVQQSLAALLRGNDEDAMDAQR